MYESCVSTVPLLVLSGTLASASGRNMSKQLWELSIPVDDCVRQRVDVMHRKWEFPVEDTVRAANCG